MKVGDIGVCVQIVLHPLLLFCGLQLLFGWEFWRVELRHCLSVRGLFHYLEGDNTRGFLACMIAGSSLVIGVEGDEMTPG